MKKKLLAIVCTIGLMIPTPSRADMFGGDVAVLVQILANALQQLYQLKQLVGNAQDSLSLMRDINQGINDSLGLYRTVFPNADPGLYKDWQNVEDGIQKLETLYGMATAGTSETRVQQDTDQGVAEAITLNNSIYNYSREIDEIGEQVKSYSHSVSPGGAQKLTAQTLGVMLHVMNQSLRAQATGLKIQAQSLAVQNRQDKAFTQGVVDGSKSFQASLKKENAKFEVPRF